MALLRIILGFLFGKYGLSNFLEGFVFVHAWKTVFLLFSLISRKTGQAEMIATSLFLRCDYITSDILNFSSEWVFSVKCIYFFTTSLITLVFENWIKNWLRCVQYTHSFLMWFWGKFLRLQYLLRMLITFRRRPNSNLSLFELK